MNTPTKPCTMCGWTKPLTEFYKNKAARDGLTHRCKDCAKQVQQKYTGRYYQPTANTLEKRELGEQGLKRCSKCSEVKPLASFAKQATGHLGLRSDCNECRKTSPTAGTLAKRAVHETGIKRCTKCSEEKPVSDFRVVKLNKNGTPFYSPSCRVCVGKAKREKQREWRKVPENREKYNAEMRAYQKERRKRPEVLEAHRLYNKSYAPTYAKRWRAENPEKAKTQSQVKRARKKTQVVEPFTVQELLASYGERGYSGCVYCGGPYEHDDHFYPLARGGEHSMRNLVPACAPCNTSKNASDPYEWMTRKGYDFRP